MSYEPKLADFWGSFTVSRLGNELKKLRTRRLKESQKETKKMWSEEEFGRAELGDARRTKRLKKIAEARALKPSASLPECFKNEAELEAMYNFCDNEAIERNQILASHILATRERIRKESIVLAVQDTI